MKQNFSKVFFPHPVETDTFYLQGDFWISRALFSGSMFLSLCL